MGGFKVKVGLFNVTSLIDGNPGCKATVNGLKSNFDFDFVFHIPLGFGYKYFDNAKSVFQLRDTFEKNYNQFKKDLDYKRLIQSIDVLLINAEGTIHSDSVGAKALLSFVKYGKQNGKKVYVVNGSYYNLSDKLLSILGQADVLFVREKKSFEYLLSKNINAKLVLDCAFLTDFIKSEIKVGTCLYTPGVLFSHGSKMSLDSKKEIIKSHYSKIIEKGFVPTFLIIENSEIELAEFWKELGGHILDSTKLEISLLLSKMSEFEMLISGRYHILIFSLMCNRKVIPLTSNTKKMIGLLESLTADPINEFQDCFNKQLLLDKPLNLNIDLSKIQNSIREDYSKLEF